MLKKFLIALVIYIVIAFPAFYLISGEINLDMILRTGIAFIIALLIAYLLSRKNEKK
ncbi:hypothetical protein ACUL41_00235 [Virgibacillus natechei]